MNFIAIIPARYASTRFPGKPLVLIKDKPMVQLVYEQCLKAFDQVAVATDDEQIVRAVESFGGNVVMTSVDHLSGTDRVAQAARLLSNQFNFDVVVNVQGDEPFIDPDQLTQIKTCFNDLDTDIATLITQIHSNDILFDPNKVKAVKNTRDFALYFSRHAVPFLRDYDKSQWLEHHSYYLHLGLYAYRKEVLQALTQLKQTPLEKSEKLEQLRWLENGYRIKTVYTNHGNHGIDTPEDLRKINNL